MIDKLLGGLIYMLGGAMLVFIASLPLMFVWKMVATGPIMQLSEGTMRATSAKLSYKGYIWKTTDGWIPIGFDSEGGLKRWKFTVKDDNQEIIDCINNNKKVKLQYKDYVLMPFREGYGHQVDGCEVIK